MFEIVFQTLGHWILHAYISWEASRQGTANLIAVQPSVNIASGPEGSLPYPLYAPWRGRDERRATLGLRSHDVVINCDTLCRVVSCRVVLCCIVLRAVAGKRQKQWQELWQRCRKRVTRIRKPVTIILAITGKRNSSTRALVAKLATGPNMTLTKSYKSCDPHSLGPSCPALKRELAKTIAGVYFNDEIYIRDQCRKQHVGYIHDEKDGPRYGDFGIRGPLFISMCYRCSIHLYLCYIICFRGPLLRGP